MKKTIVKPNQMKKLLVLSLLLVTGMLEAQIIIPDSVFMAKLLESSPTNAIAQDNMGNNIAIDANNDGQISSEEALNVYFLDVSNPDYIYQGPKISNMTGIDNFPSLRKLDCAVNNIPSIDFTFLGSLWTLDCHGNNLTALVIPFAPQIKYLDCSFNSITSLDLSTMTTLEHFDCRVNLIPSLDISMLNGLQKLIVSGNSLIAIDFPSMPNIETIDCSANALTTIDLSGIPTLKTLAINDNLLTSIDLTPVPNLTSLDVGANLLASIDITNLAGLKSFSCYRNNISTLDFSGNPLIWVLFIEENQITTIDLNPLPALLILECSNNLLTSIDLSPTPLLNILLCHDNSLTTIDGSMCNLLNLDCRNNLLVTILLKNGVFTNATNTLDFSGNPTMQYICADESEAVFLQSKIVDYGYTNCFVSSYCSFTPGGDYNTITGSILFDANSNGCDIGDLAQPNIKLSINDGTTTGATFSNVGGNYNFYTLAGNFTVTPDVENPTFFNFTPTNASVLFTDTNNNVATHNFCVSANGTHADAEVVIAPLDRSRPGFDTRYKVVYKNKGNQVLSGNVVFNYNDAVLDIESISVTPDTQNSGLLQWNYTNLMPFESRSIIVIVNVNTPMETPSVNLGDILNFTADITVAGDELPSDNHFVLNHTVVNAWDPNEITCIEGENVTPNEIGEYLHYVVNFENTGSAEAENVVVRVDIDPAQYNIGTLQILDASHESRSVITGNTVEFIFRNINLPVAGDPPVNGHGTILFKIRTIASLEVGDQVANTANIFFDYNYPIETEEARTTFASLSNPDYIKDASVVLHPNPTKGNIKIDADHMIKSIDLYDVQGRILQTSIENTTTAQLDITNKANGIYFVKITTERGTNIEKVVKE